MNKPDLHIRLRQARKKLELNQSEIATDLSIHQKSISEIENGKIVNIPNSYIYYFYKKGVSLEWLYDEKGGMLQEDSKDLKNNEQTEKQLEFHLVKEKKENTYTNKVEKEEEPYNITKDILNVDEKLIESKDETIKSLEAYINSLENNLQFFKTLLNDALYAGFDKKTNRFQK